MQLGDAAAPTPTSFYEIKERDINGATVDFAQFEGKVVYVVNVASYCGYTESNYQLINQLNNKYANKGLEVVVFPCNQFGAQEPGSGQEITNFAKAKGFSGTIMSKGDVNGDKTRPTFKFLKDRTAKNYITWYWRRINFARFILIFVCVGISMENSSWTRRELPTILTITTLMRRSKNTCMLRTCNCGASGSVFL